MPYRTVQYRTALCWLCCTRSIIVVIIVALPFATTKNTSSTMAVLTPPIHCHVCGFALDSSRTNQFGRVAAPFCSSLLVCFSLALALAASSRRHHGDSHLLPLSNRSSIRAICQESGRARRFATFSDRLCASILSAGYVAFSSQSFLLVA